MNVLRYSLWCFCILLVVSVRAQVLEWSTEQSFRNKTAYNKIVGENKSGLFMIRGKSNTFKKKLILEHYSPELKLLYSKSLEGLRRATFVQALMIQDTIRLFKSAYDGSTHELLLQVQSLNNKGELLPDEKTIARAPERFSGDDGDFWIEESLDKSKLLIMHTSVSENRKLVVHFNILMQDGMVPLTKKNYELDDDYNKSQITNIKLDKNGKVCFIVSVNNRKKGESRYRENLFRLYLFNAYKGEMSDLLLNHEAAFFWEPYMSVNQEKNELTVSGMYSDNEQNKATGLQHETIDLSDFSRKSRQVIYFERELLTSLIGEKRSSYKPELEDYYIRKVIPTSDGGHVVIAEEYFVTRQSYTYFINGLTQISSRDVFNYGNIFMVCSDSAGNVLWNKAIMKSQVSIMDRGYYSSFNTVTDRDRINIFYNDENRGTPDVTLFSVNMNGESTQKLLFRNNSGSIALASREALQLYYNSTVIPVAKDKKFALLRVTF